MVHTCGGDGCHQGWYSCTRADCPLTSRNYFSNLRTLKAHAIRCHPVLSDSGLPTTVRDDMEEHPFEVALEEHMDIDLPAIGQDKPTQFVFGNQATQTFVENLQTKPLKKTITILVMQSLYQATYSATLPDVSEDEVKLFLWIAALVMTFGIGEFILNALAAIMEILFKYLPKFLISGRIPTTTAGYYACMTNRTKKMSFFTILPIVSSKKLDSLHAICPMEELVAHALMLPQLHPPACERMRLLSESPEVQKFLLAYRESPIGGRGVAIAILVWMDGWDPNQSNKSNRGSAWTGTSTLLIIDGPSGTLLCVSTYPFAAAPDKEVHDIVFDDLARSLKKYGITNDASPMWSAYHKSFMHVVMEVVVWLQDQPDKRFTSGTLGGGSKQHSIFGLSCNFQALDLPFNACSFCTKKIVKYLKKGMYSSPPTTGCRRCYGWSLSVLLAKGRYRSSIGPDFSKRMLGQDKNIPTPAANVANRPLLLTHDLLCEGWNHAVCRYAVDDDSAWTQAEVTEYLYLLCFNRGRVDYFLTRCCNFMVAGEIDLGNLSATDIEEEIVIDRKENPEKYQVPPPPSGLFIGCFRHQPDTPMHTMMNVQKSVLKFIMRWAATNSKASALLS